MENKTLIHIEFDNSEFHANVILVSEVGQRKELLICEGANISTLPNFLRKWATFATFTFSPC